MIVDFSNKIGRVLGALAFFFLLLPSVCLAGKPVHEINYFQSHVMQENGQTLLRIEIGLNRPDPEYKVQVNAAKPKQLLLDLENTEIGDIRKDITLDGKLARFMTFRELERRHTQVMVAMSQPAAGLYRVYTQAADRKAQKPYRIVIDVLAAPIKAPADKVAGVTGKVIVLDPGHGGTDSGAIGPDGVQEKDVTLSVARRVRDILTASGARVAMTRDTDCDVYGANATDRQELQARVNVGAYTPGTQVFLSIHCNAFSSPDANGTATYYYPKSDYDAVLAQDLQQQLVAAGGLRDRGINEANFYVVKRSAMPAALVELAFITNYREEALLSDDDFQNKMAMAICQGLGKFFTDTGI